MIHAALALWVTLQGPASAPLVLDLDGCVAAALQRSPKRQEAQAKVRAFSARLAEVQAIYTPKLNALGYLAPMFTVEGDALRGVERRYGPKDWGPYTHFEAILSLPLYSFGRVEAGGRAAAARVEVERARVAEAERLLAFEVRRYALLHLYAIGLRPTLRFGQRTLDAALLKAEALYAEGGGTVTQADVMRLRMGVATLRRYAEVAEVGQALALAALKHTMGLAEDAPLRLKDAGLPPISPAPLLSLPACLKRAAAARPSWRMLSQGEAAALSLVQAERLANAPVLFAAGTLAMDWAPTRDDADNPYHADPYNQITGGLAVGLKWDLDMGATRAKADAAQAQVEEIRALRAFAESGIPLQVRKAHQGITSQTRLLKHADASLKAARAWMTFATAAYESNTGEARDALEGLLAYLTAKQHHAEQLRAYHEARAELIWAMGELHEGALEGAP
ncbi:TolC family protein [Myxococcota bacterium]|nr:TolC family protein [Myxococcota bacterium]MBU1900294.1 TolC family protein [Myxococcota bacterium]